MREEEAKKERDKHFSTI
jgi:hypothetical protein